MKLAGCWYRGSFILCILLLSTGAAVLSVCPWSDVKKSSLQLTDTYYHPGTICISLQCRFTFHPQKLSEWCECFCDVKAVLSLTLARSWGKGHKYTFSLLFCFVGPKRQWKCGKYISTFLMWTMWFQPAFKHWIIVGWPFVVTWPPAWRPPKTL